MSTSRNIAKRLEQVCAIPFRREDSAPEFCLITSLKKKRWIFPKGIIDPGETFVESALKEAYEEAGLRGHILEHELGRFEDFKWDTHLSIRVVMMQVTGCEPQWPETDLRQRKWVSGDEGVELLHKAKLKEFLAAASNHLNTT